MNNNNTIPLFKSEKNRETSIEAELTALKR
jgi:hypothetical protein